MNERNSLGAVQQKLKHTHRQQVKADNDVTSTHNSTTTRRVIETMRSKLNTMRGIVKAQSQQNSRCPMLLYTELSQK